MRAELLILSGVTLALAGCATALALPSGAPLVVDEDTLVVTLPQLLSVAGRDAELAAAAAEAGIEHEEAGDAEAAEGEGGEAAAEGAAPEGEKAESEDA